MYPRYMTAHACRPTGGTESGLLRRDRERGAYALPLPRGISKTSEASIVQKIRKQEREAPFSCNGVYFSPDFVVVGSFYDRTVPLPFA